MIDAMNEYIKVLRDSIRDISCNRLWWEVAIDRLCNEVERLKAGKFTEEEFQNICHNFSEDDKQRFKAGCEEYTRKLFGQSCWERGPK